ncbi:MAG: DUF2730 family protein [Vibrio sp.]|uniref:DUF2730 family protein n=1 Tax=Vibrio sp. TaxID=678 RepID=UPI003A87AB47
MKEMQDVMDLLRTIWQVMAPFVSVFIALALLSLRKVFVSQVQFDELKLSHQELKNHVGGLPTQNEVNRLRVEMEVTRGEIKELRAALKPVDHLTKLLLEKEMKE